jgi:cell division septal protein FtsQ
MRDYKNVKVPRSYRTRARNVTTKRVQVVRGTRRSEHGTLDIKRLAVQFFMIVVVAAGGWLGWQAYGEIMRADLLQIAGVDVKGVKQLSEADIREIVGPFRGKNIFRADLDAAIRRAYANPWIKDARVHRRLPNRISMVFTERVPAVILDTGSSRYLMDDEGVIIERLKKERVPAWRLPVVVIKDYRTRPGDQVLSDGMKEAFALIAEISARGGWKLADVTIMADSPETLSLLYADHEFRIGSGNYAEKLRRLGEVMADVQQRGLEIAYVDLRPERQAAVMMKDNRIQGQGSRVKGKKP